MRHHLRSFLRSSRHAIAIGFLTVGTTGVALAEDQAPPASEVFGADRVWSLHLEVSAEEYAALQPTGGFAFGPPGGQGGPSQPPAQPQEQRPSVANLFGMQFPWVEARVTVEDATYSKVGLRYAGDGTYFASAFGVKRPLAIEFDRFEDQRFHGVRAIQLHSGPLDAAKARETLAYAVYRAAGVPAPRTAYAEVTLTVPGQFDRELLGLYTLVEEVDAEFLTDRFGAADGLLFYPRRMRGPDYLGEEWAAYLDQWQPQGEATSEQAQRTIALARLIQQADDAEFARDVEAYLDVEAFLRFMAASTLLSQVDGFFALGHNYHLYLRPDGRFAFIPGEQELALGNFAMMGSAEQLMDLSLAHPYPGECRLADRLLTIDTVAAQYRNIVAELSESCFNAERLLADIEAIERTTAEAIRRETEAATARAAAAPAGPGGFGAGGGFFPPPPDLRTFVEKRRESVAAQLAGTSTGYVPEFNFGPPGGRQGPPEPVDDVTVQELVQAPPEFDVTLFAAPPDVGYPVAVAAAPTGEVYIAVDEQGSLGRTPGGGKVLRCRDTDGDGKADELIEFARMEHPRGVVCQGDTVWVLHPPLLSVFHDDDGNGISDRQDVLVTGLTTSLIDERGGDHTTNGIRLAVDGWIYICVGDYGILEARGVDGATISQRGGGIVRVRPDGTGLEPFAVGLRNPFDIAIDPALNMFTRDNTNDGAGWDIRVSHLVQSGSYGYTQLYANFPEETAPPLGVYGGGGGTGSLFVEDPHWPGQFRDALYTGDWGRSEVYRHPLTADGPTFTMTQEVFLTIPRPTGMDFDGNGRLYVASWRGGEAAVNVGPNVGFVALVTPKGLDWQPAANVREADLDALVAALCEPNAVRRLHAQREIIRRGPAAETSRKLTALAKDAAAPLGGRVAAIFALKQLEGLKSHATLLELVADSAVREFALRALTDRRSELEGVTAAPFVAALADESARVRAQAAISLGRLGDVSVAAAIVPLTSRADGSTAPTHAPLHTLPDPGRVLPHVAVRALIALNAVDECLAALDGPHRRGALLALRSMHDERAVDGLIKKLGTTLAAEQREEILSTLIRLYHREADYDGSWWGIRPDSTGPYYDGRPWAGSERIAALLRTAYTDGDAATVEFLGRELARHQVFLDGLPSAADVAAQPAEVEKPVVVPQADPANPDQIGNLAYEAAVARALAAEGDVARGKLLFTAQSCRACHTVADGQSPRGPHLVNIGLRYAPPELLESILKPSAKLAQGFETNVFLTVDGLQHSGFVVSESASAVRIRDLTGIERVLPRDEIDERERVLQSAMPVGMANNLTPEQLADLVAYLRSLE